MSSQWDPTAPRPEQGEDAATQAVPWGAPVGSSAVPPTTPYSQGPGSGSWAAVPGSAPESGAPASAQPSPPYGPVAPQHGAPPAPQYGAGSVPQYGPPAPTYGASGQPGQAGYPGAYQPYYAAATRDTSAAMTQLVVGCVLMLVCLGFTALPAVICGAMAMSGNRPQEDIDRLVRTGWKWTAILVGISVVLAILYFVFFFAVMTSSSGASALGAL